MIDREGASTVWDDTFADDQDAYDEFYRALESEGIRSLGAPVELVRVRPLRKS